ncbi:MAG: response regulator [Acidobacteria bacterium]|nr:response regulator [Acidobacteriota bacterium]
MPPSTDHYAARILIVDDQPSNVRLLEHTLKRGGFTEVSSTGNPREVVALHMKNRYALIVLDLQMPEMNGYEVMEELQKIAEAHPVAILVMSADQTQATAAVEAGAISFLGKPFVLADVVGRVLEILETAAGPDQGGAGGNHKPEARSQK